MMGIQQLFELHQLAMDGILDKAKKRFLFETISQSTGKHFKGIVGGRGVGKSVLLKQLAKETKNSMYISIDTMVEIQLFDLVKTLSQDYGITHFYLDEIHFHPSINEDLKKIYDFLDISIVFSSSIALKMVESSHDLSRRVRLYTLWPFSFREYLYFKTDTLLPPLRLDTILEGKADSCYLKYSHHLRPYMQGGLMPFHLDEPNVIDILRNILYKIIQNDIPRAYDIATSDLRLIHKVISFIALSDIDGISYSSLSTNIGITKYKAELFVSLLERAFIVSVIFPKGSNITKEPKIVLSLPYRLLFRPFETCIGAIREEFVVAAFKQSQMPFHYLKGKRGQKTPDYLIKRGEKKIAIEVGGKNKGTAQFKGIKVDQKYIFAESTGQTKTHRPLELLGFVSSPSL